MRSRTRLVLAAFLLLASILRAGAADKIPDGYERRDVEGFTVYVGISVLRQPHDRFGRRGPAYARTNAAEYFAEVSCAYLDSCNYFPFNNEQLHGHDPSGFKFVKRVWEEPDRFSVITVKSDIEGGKGGKGGTSTT